MAKAKANISDIHTAALIQSLLQVPTLATEYKMMLQAGWKLHVVDQQRGRCYYKDKVITIPLWAWNSTKHNYWIYYVAHEFAHIRNPHQDHNYKFMETFKELCPVDCQHYELEYKLQNAAAAGISQHKSLNAEKTEVKKASVNWIDLL